MLKKCLLIFMLSGLIPVCAGELENAFAKNDNVFVYLYTPQCTYCQKFMPQYDKLVKTYGSQFAFVKLDASTYYGNKVLRTYHGRYVPYVILLSNKRNKGVQILPSCLMEYVCTEKELKKFNS